MKTLHFILPYICGSICMGIHIAYDYFILNLTLVRPIDPKILFPNKVLGTINREHGRLHVGAFTEIQQMGP